MFPKGRYLILQIVDQDRESSLKVKKIAKFQNFYYRPIGRSVEDTTTRRNGYHKQIYEEEVRVVVCFMSCRKCFID